MAKLDGKVALITGGSRGVGAAISKALAKYGALVIVTSRSANKLESIRSEIVDAGGNCIAIASDCTDSDQVADLFAKIHEQGSGLDILVNNVGGALRFGGLFDLTDEDWLRAYDFNVVSAVRHVREAMPLLRKSRSPRIINISSLTAVQPGTYNPHYAATKAAMLNLSKYLAKKFSEDGILVNTVCPGPVVSDSWDANIVEQAEKRGITVDRAKREVDGEEAEKIPLGRIGTGDDVAGLVSFLASDEASWITGSCFHVDGGKLQTV